MLREPSDIRWSPIWLVLWAVGCGGTSVTSGQSNPGDGSAGSAGKATEPAHRCGACAAEQVCCFASGNCYSPLLAPEACEPPPPPEPLATGEGGAGGGDLVSSDHRPCSSNAHCRADEFCRPESDASACVATGYCVARSCTLQCLGGADCNTPVCGCDGETYATEHDACQAGVRVAATAACGEPVAQPGPPVIGCSDDSQCPNAYSCCAISGRCYESSCPGCCTVPPKGSTGACERDNQCAPDQYCAGSGCGTAGGCMWRRSAGDCTGELSEVCGCDGKRYSNQCWAAAAGVRVANAGQCRTGG